MNKEKLWYIIEKHTNIRLHGADGTVIYDDYDRAGKGAARMSTGTECWYIPIRASEYDEIYG